MKRKLFLGLASVAILAAAAFVTITTVNANTPKLSDLMTKNLEALTQNEGTAVADCWSMGWSGDNVFANNCDGYTSPDMIYPCHESYMRKGISSKCTK